AQTVEPLVVTDVHDHGEVDPIERGEPPGHAGPAHSTGQLDNSHHPKILLMGPVRFTMADRMTSSSAPPEAEQTPNEARATAPKVLVLLTTVEGADLDAAVAAVRRQVYDPAPEIWIVGEAEEREGVSVVPNLEAAISRADQTVEYLWILHADARPRPDALAALVREVERNEAALGGSKLLVAGTPDVLESVGSATDVFGEPYSGLEEGEIDLQQYDVLREVAFVRSAS